MLDTLHSGLVWCSGILGDSPSLKSRYFSKPLSSEWGGFAGYVDIYNKRSHGSWVTAPFEAAWHQPASLFRSAFSMALILGALKESYSRGAFTVVKDIANKGLVGTAIEYFFYGGTENITDWTYRALSGIGRKVHEYFIEFRNAGLQYGESIAQQEEIIANEAHILSRLRHNKHCIANDVCSSIILEIDRLPRLSSYVLPTTILLGALGASAYFYAFYSANNEENDSLPADSSLTEEGSHSSST